MIFSRLPILFVMICALFVRTAAGQELSAPEPQPGTVIGTVIDVNGDVVPDASVTLQGPELGDHRTIHVTERGFFSFDNVKSGIPYHLTVSGQGFADWNSPEIKLTPGQYMEVSGIRLQIAEAVTTVAVTPDEKELATEQLAVEEKQRVLGVIPNFYTVYDKNAAPLTSKMKYQLAFRTMTDPVTFAGAAFIAGINQAADTPHYQQGWKGYGQRFGAGYATGLTDILIGGAVLPSLLHQDPRYFYQGTGTTKSRLIHALSTPFICKGDNGKWQFNASSLGGYFASGAIAESYYPDRDRGVGLAMSTAGIDIAATMANGIIQEFILKKFTPSAKKRP